MRWKETRAMAEVPGCFRWNWLGRSDPMQEALDGAIVCIGKPRLLPPGRLAEYDAGFPAFRDRDKEAPC